MAMGESPSAMEDLDATNVIETEKEETEEKTATVEKYPSFVLFTILNGILLVLTVLAGSAFIIIGNFLDAFGSSKVWGNTNHFYLDIEIVTVCLFGFITIINFPTVFISFLKSPLVTRKRLMKTVGRLK